MPTSLVFTVSRSGLTGELNKYFSTPDHADFALTELDARVLAVSPFDNWAAVFVSNHLVGQAPGAGTRNWVVTVHPNGHPRTVFGGINGTEAPFVVGARANEPYWLRTCCRNQGGVLHTEYLTADPFLAVPAAGDWVSLGEVVESAPASGIDATAPLSVPGSEAQLAWMTRYFYFEVRSSRDGPIVCNPDFRQLEPGTTAFVDSTGKLWTAQAGAQVVAAPRFVTVGI